MEKYKKIYVNPYSLPLPKCEHGKYPIGSSGCKYKCGHLINYEQESDDHGRLEEICVTCVKHLQ